MIGFVALTPKAYSYLTDDNNAYKKDKGIQKCVIKRILKFNSYKDCLFNNKPILKSRQTLTSEAHKVYTKETNKIALRSNDDKRLQTFYMITSYPYGTNAGKVCKPELLGKYNWLNLMVIHMRIKQNIFQSSHTFQIIHTEY